jgi:hypothetical protein
MWRRRGERGPEAPPATHPVELAPLLAECAEWGAQAGYLKLEIDLEPRLQAQVDDAVLRGFGDWRAAMRSVLTPLEAAESEMRELQRVISAFRVAERSLAGSWLRRLGRWWREWREYRAALALCRRRLPVVRGLRAAAEAAGRVSRDAETWRDAALSALRAQYEFSRQRATSAREQKENQRDRHEDRTIALRRAV